MSIILWDFATKLACRILAPKSVVPGLTILLVVLLTAGGLLAQATSHRQESAPISPPSKAYGLSTAPIRMDVFTDYQCPRCREFYDQTLQPLIRYYVADGKVYLVHHDFPLQIHKYSGEAARWANACAEVGQFEAAETALYDNQDAWARTETWKGTSPPRFQPPI